MDPEEALRQIRIIANAILADTDALNSESHPRDCGHVLVLAESGHNLATVVTGLDEWLTGGGFLPADWTPGAFDNPKPMPTKAQLEADFQAKHGRAPATTTLWQLQCIASWTGDDGWARTLSMPTIVLNGNIQGIIGEAHARDIARKMIEDLVTLNGSRELPRDYVCSTAVAWLDVTT